MGFASHAILEQEVVIRKLRYLLPGEVRWDRSSAITGHLY